MKDLLLQYAAYHTWANAALLQVIEGLPEDVQQAQLHGSFPSLYKTVLHLLDAESMWWQRLKLQERVERPSDSFSGSFKELSGTLQNLDAQWQEWIKGSPEHSFQHEFIYRDFKKRRFKQPVYQVIMQVFNHATYHRGQLVTMLREVGVSKIPPTDFIVWCRKK